jgi:hypothetical protein
VLPASRSVAVPTPPDRPFELGRYAASPAVVANETRPLVAAAPAPQPRATYAEANRTTRPALIPVAGHGALMINGRGLY